MIRSHLLGRGLLSILFLTSALAAQTAALPTSAPARLALRTRRLSSNFIPRFAARSF